MPVKFIVVCLCAFVTVHLFQFFSLNARSCCTITLCRICAVYFAGYYDSYDGSWIVYILYRVHFNIVTYLLTYLLTYRIKGDHLSG